MELFTKGKTNFMMILKINCKHFVKGCPLYVGRCQTEMMLSDDTVNY